MFLARAASPSKISPFAMAFLSSLPCVTCSARAFGPALSGSVEKRNLCFRTHVPAATRYVGQRPTSPAASPESLYEVLGISQNATGQEIKAAYRRLTRMLHPDVAAEDDTARDFIKAHEAYKTLSDIDKRAVYDRSLFRRSVPLSSVGAAAAAPVSTASGYWRFGRWRWETDQCW